jgi:hypothetical protein
LRITFKRTSGIVAVFAVVLVLAWAATASAERLSHGDQRIFRLAFAELDKGNTESALRIARRGTDPLLVKTVYWSHLVRGGTGVTFEQVQRFRQENPNWPRQHTLRAKAEIRLPRSLSDQEVLDFFGATGPATVNGIIRKAEALLGLDRAREAGLLLRKTWIDSNLTPGEERTFRTARSTPGARARRARRASASR